ncbi:MAG: tRNA lysidine(34) synthetase [bacterium]
MKENSSKYTRTLKKRVVRDIYKHHLIRENDKILIALSGGKDSLILLDCLLYMRDNLCFKMDLVAVHVDITNIPYDTDLDFLTNYCNSREVPFDIIKKEIKLDTGNHKQKGICFPCSWNRRKLLFKYCHQNNCNKLAFGHHMDDALETLMMNMIYHGSISSLPWKIKMFEGKLEIIRPLLHMKEKELAQYANLENFPKEIKVCSFGEKTKRILMKNMIKTLEEIHPNARTNVFKSMDKIFSEYLPTNK